MREAGYTRGMGDVNVECDRCHKTIEGYRTENFTSGFYDVSAGYWSKYARRGEEILCDRCMWTSPAYQKDYGTHIIDGLEHNT